MKSIVSIAGSDCSGGAGIQADIKTITMHGMYAMSVITALTAQNTLGVCGIQEVTPDFIAQQMDCIFTDIRPDAVKIGMFSNSAVIETIAQRIAFYKAENVVLDTVMVSTSGKCFLSEEAITTLIAKLFPLAAVITPNIPEAEVLCGHKINSQEDMRNAAESISGLCSGAVLLKGGHLSLTADDLLYDGGICHWFKSARIDNPNTHGTGCTLSSAIACNLAMGFSLEESVKNAKKYVTGALKAGLNLGRGNGPLQHNFSL